MEEKLISVEVIKQMHPIFRKSYGELLAKIVIKIAGLEQVNRVHDAGRYKKGSDVEDAMIDFMGIRKMVLRAEVLQQFEGKPFITVSNHPYGHIDGILLIGEMAKIRPDFKVMVNWVLGMIKSMQDHFIGVNPYRPGTISNRSSFSGIKECISHLRDNHPLGFFPAGAISKTKIKKIEDREWQPNVLKMIQKAQVPVVPIFISGNNSRFFRFLDLIDWRIRTVRLCHELKNKKGKTIHLVIGDPVSVEEQQEYKDVQSFGFFLKQQTYALRSYVIGK